ncbi:hypothetical protein PPYR_10666 [Photinus pyralis]|uniref:Uncharacterized protein n=1 Tax=Photinus pyralis TaxID=7054 RepID=A0A1Y1L1U2_PHOPY|nr:hypothetical protein PPYR_10666 [Photinus pyralis]
MEEPENEPPFRVLRRGTLTPVVTNIHAQTPESKLSAKSPDEFIIQQRGRRCKPIVWSPVEYNKKDLFGPPRDKTPERVTRGVEINPKLRRRLVMSPDRNLTSSLGDAIAKKLKALSYSNDEITQEGTSDNL